jgi:hypothetical protein
VSALLVRREVNSRNTELYEIILKIYEIILTNDKEYWIMRIAVLRRFQHITVLQKSQKVAYSGTYRHT